MARQATETVEAFRTMNRKGDLLLSGAWDAAKCADFRVRGFCRDRSARPLSPSRKGRAPVSTPASTLIKKVLSVRVCRSMCGHVAPYT